MVSKSFSQEFNRESFGGATEHNSLGPRFDTLTKVNTAPSDRSYRLAEEIAHQVFSSPS
jgi:hypothetical protein